MDEDRERHGPAITRPRATRCQLMLAALFLVGTSLGGWFLILHFLV